MMAAVTLLAGASSVGCSKRDKADDIGSVGLALTLPGGAMINTVSYTITGGPAPGVNIPGTIDVSGPGVTTATALVSGLLAGSYSVTMTATASDGQSCTGTQPFTVVSGQTAMANVILQCTTTVGRGQVAINGRFDQCPFITGFTATALTAPVGGTITVGVNATELDPGDTIAYSWTNSAPGIGTLAPTNAATGVFTCNAAGSASLSVTVTDGICGDTRMDAIPITCTGGTGGSGGGAAGAPGGSGGGEAGAPGGSGGGAAGAPGGSGGTECIETNPPAAIAAACDACLDMNQNPTTDGCCNITSDPTGFSLCQAASACMRSGIVNGADCNVDGDTGTCYCGTSTTCSSGGANGPCVAEITAAAGRNTVTQTTDSPTPGQILMRFGAPEFALGRASGIHGVAGAVCPAECGI
jgi:hypothetical protein